jgi:hypothetical protein
MRKSQKTLAATTFTAIVSLSSLLLFAGPTFAEEQKPKGPIRHQANIKFGDVTVESSAKKKQTKKPKVRSVQFEDVHVGKEVDKASPRLSSGGTKPQGGGNPLAGGILDSQSGPAATGPAATGTGPSRGGGAAAGPVFR